MKTSFESRIFQTWEFKVSHGQLLIRSPSTIEYSTNIDVMFAGVEYLDLPRHLNTIELEKPSEADISFVRDRMGKPVNADSVFVIISGSRRFHVVAAGVKVAENELDIFDSPFK